MRLVVLQDLSQVDQSFCFSKYTSSCVTVGRTPAGPPGVPGGGGGGGNTTPGGGGAGTTPGGGGGGRTPAHDHGSLEIMLVGIPSWQVTEASQELFDTKAI